MAAHRLEAEPRERFIPVRKGDIVAALLAEPRLATAEVRDEFGQFCKLVGSVLHYEHFEELERLKEAYHHFNPHHSGQADAATEAAYAELVDTLRRVLTRANFIEVTADELARAAEERALFEVEVRAATDDYRDVTFFRRGRHRERVERREWMGLRARHFDVDVYDDVVMVATLRPEGPVAGTRLRRFRPRRRHRPGSMLIKCFRDIPGADLNTLLPDVRVIMGQRDKWMIGLPALVGGIPLLLKLGPTLAVLAILIGVRLGASGEAGSDGMEQALIVTSGLLALGGFMMHQWVKYQHQALRHQIEINGNLYFRNVSNNAGMFDAIIGAAEEQEFKEAALAYFFLLGEPVGREELDRKIEAWLAAQFGVAVDFELEDGLAKLERLGLAGRPGRRPIRSRHCPRRFAGSIAPGTPSSPSPNRIEAPAEDSTSTRVRIDGRGRTPAPHGRGQNPSPCGAPATRHRPRSRRSACRDPHSPQPSRHRGSGRSHPHPS